MKEKNESLPRVPWTAATVIGAVIWSIISLGFTFFFSLFIMFAWSESVTPKLTANSSGEARHDLTRTDVIQSILSNWWPLVGIAVLFIGVWGLTHEIFSASGRRSPLFTLVLSTLCALLATYIWTQFGLDIWHQYGAPLSR